MVPLGVQWVPISTFVGWCRKLKPGVLPRPTSLGAGTKMTAKDLHRMLDSFMEGIERIEVNVTDIMNPDSDGLHLEELPEVLAQIDRIRLCVVTVGNLSGVSAGIFRRNPVVVARLAKLRDLSRIKPLAFVVMGDCDGAEYVEFMKGYLPTYPYGGPRSGAGSGAGSGPGSGAGSGAGTGSGTGSLLSVVNVVDPIIHTVHIGVDLGLLDGTLVTDAVVEGWLSGSTP